MPRTIDREPKRAAVSSERWFYFAIAVFFVAIIATFGTLIWQIATAFK